MKFRKLKYKLCNQIRFTKKCSSVNGIKVTGTVSKGSTFTLAAGVLWNYTSSSHTWTLKAVLTDKDGNWKQDLSSTRNVTVGSYLGTTLSSLSCTVSSDMALGDRIALWYRSGDGWAPVVYDHSDLARIWEYAYVDACFIKVSGSYAAGDRYYFNLIQGNKGINSLKWFYDGSETSEDSVKLSAGTHTVSAAITFTDGTAETITQMIVAR